MGEIQRNTGREKSREKYKEIQGKLRKVGRNTKKCWEREKSREKYKEIQRKLRKVGRNTKKYWERGAGQ